MTILYLHGFRSSPASHKSRVMAKHIQQMGLENRWHCPQLPASPREAADLAYNLVKGSDPEHLVIMGSSLGGFYATWLAEQTGARAILINPLVHAVRELRQHVGSHRNYHDDAPFEFQPYYVDELAALTVARITHPNRYLLLAAKGDEVLDWREMRDHYTGAEHIIVEGGDHAFSDFEHYLPKILAFAGLSAAPGPSS